MDQPIPPFSLINSRNKTFLKNDLTAPEKATRCTLKIINHKLENFRVSTVKP